ncbi:MAG: cytochrome c oxidase subunit III [bacterium]|nr:MAG: cytochrome c oxidase subunit III [bacterium]
MIIITVLRMDKTIFYWGKTMTEHVAVEHTHPGYWEWSWAPFSIVFGILFGVPLAFAGYFVYENSLMFGLSAGFGVVLLLGGISKWVSEGLSQHHGQYGYSEVALPLFIISEAFIFLGLFVSYWTLRLSAESWPPAGTPHIDYALPMFMTVVLLTSSFTIYTAEVKLEGNDQSGFKIWLAATIVLGTFFLGCSMYEYNHLIHEGFGPDANAYSTAFYAITGFHASHVLVGICIFISVLLPALAGKSNITFLRCASVYWHFVDIVWLFVVSQVYFW